MSEKLFRGKTQSGEWIEGNFIDWGNHVQVYIFPLLNYATSYNLGTSISLHAKAVIPETIGQDTGRIDRNFKRIFEGDIVTGLFLFGLPVNAVVTFQDGAFGLEWYRGGDLRAFNAFTSICNVEYEVIGNVHDNPELLKGEKE